MYNFIKFNQHLIHSKISIQFQYYMYYRLVNTSFQGQVTQFKVTEIFYVHKSEIQLNIEDFMLPEIYTPENCFTCHQY